MPNENPVCPSLDLRKVPWRTTNGFSPRGAPRGAEARHTLQTRRLFIIELRRQAPADDEKSPSQKHRSSTQACTGQLKNQTTRLDGIEVHLIA